MQNSQNKKALQVVLIALIAVVTLGIGYASITAINLIINGNATASVDQNNFKVKFLNETGVTPIIEGAPTNTISVDSDTTASFNISTLNSVGQSVIATYRVKNESNGIGASIALQLESSNTEYFKVTDRIIDDTLQAGEETTVTVKVEMLKTPITDSVSTIVTATLVATPLDDADANGGNENEVVRPAQYVYTINQFDYMYLNINSPIPNEVRTYSNFAAAKADFQKPAAIAHVVENNKIVESYIAFEKNDRIFYIRGGVNEETLPEKIVFEKNIIELKRAFGEENCNIYEDYVYCYGDGFAFHSYITGMVSIRNNFSCIIEANGKSACDDYKT